MQVRQGEPGVHRPVFEDRLQPGQAMKDVPGSSPLTPEQQAEMEKRYGLRYSAVADGGLYRGPRKKTFATSIKKRSKR